MEERAIEDDVAKVVDHLQVVANAAKEVSDDVTTT